MKKYYFLIIIIAVCNAMFSCKTYDGSIKISQNDNEVSFSAGEAQIELKKAPFKISFYNKEYSAKDFYAAQLVALDDFDTFKAFCSGISTSESVFFSPGTGMAPDETGRYESLIITDKAHHYLFYSKDEKFRLVKSGKSGKFCLLNFNIDTIFDGISDIPIRDFNKNNLYIIIFIDRNLDEIIDHNELYKLKITFE